MVDAVTPTLEICSDPRSVSEAAAEFIAGTIVATVAAQNRCAIALAGGRTPRGTYGLLAERHGDRVPWSSVHVFWGDERCVPPDDPDSNFGMAKDTLLGRVLIPPRNVHRIQGERSPADAAEAYEAELRAFFPRDFPLPAFDCVILGAGADGHTASLFPGSWALDEANRWAMAVEAPDGVPCRHRVTLTLPAINASKTVLFLITGADKSRGLRDLCRDPATPAATPAGLVRPGRELRVFADEAATGEWPGGTRP